MREIALLIIGLVTIQRLMELPIAKRNTARLISEGAKEYFPKHYPLFIVLHSSWLVALVISLLLTPSVQIIWPLSSFYFILQLARFYILRTLGPRWTTKIIHNPEWELVDSGIYRYIKHPNYLVVFFEIIVLPLSFGLWQLALIFGVANSMLLAYRICLENRVLALNKNN